MDALKPPADTVVCRLDPFRDVPPEAVRDFLLYAEWVQLGANVLFRQGELMRPEAYLLVQGRLNISVEAGGKRQTLADVWPGEIVGEAALFTPATERGATVSSPGPGWALRITPRLLSEQSDHPAVLSLEQHLLKTLARRAAGTNQLIARLRQERERMDRAAAASREPQRGAAARADRPKAEPPRVSHSRPVPDAQAGDNRPAAARPASPAARRPEPQPPADEPASVFQRISRWFGGGS
jgi:CRP-like cAMP-binding protein